MEDDLLASKQKIGEIVNIVMETGENDLIDQVYSVMGRAS